MRIVCQQTILMKYHALFVIFEKGAKFEIVVCCKLFLFVFVALRPMSTALVIVGRSVHLTTLFPGKA